MTLPEFRELVATLPEEIAVVHFRDINRTLPRAVWQESRITQTYASNGACMEKTTVVMEYMTRDEEDPNVRVIKDLFRELEMPFTCDAGYDPENDFISYLFSLYLEEEV